MTTALILFQLFLIFYLYYKLRKMKFEWMDISAYAKSLEQQNADFRKAWKTVGEAQVDLMLLDIEKNLKD